MQLLSRLQNVFEKYFPSFQNFLRVLKFTKFWATFNLTVLNSIQLLKNYCKTSLNVLFKKNL